MCTDRRNTMPRDGYPLSSVASELQRYREDAEFFRQNEQSFLEMYDDQCIAILDKRLIGSARNMEQLVAELEQRGIRPGQAFTTRVVSARERQDAYQWIRSTTIVGHPRAGD